MPDHWLSAAAGLNHPGLPKVSAIIPCYNGGEMLRRAIESVLRQTMWDAMELILVDDGSRDGTLELLDGFAARPGITVLKNGSNRGISATKNRGVGAARGEFIAFLDQDDLWLEDKIAKQSALFLDPQLGLAVCALSYQDDQGRQLGTPLLPAEMRQLPAPGLLTIDRATAAFLLKFPVPSASTVMVRKSCFDRYGLLNEKLYSGDEIEFCSRVIGGHRIAFAALPLVSKTVHGANASNNIGKMRLARLMLLDEIVANVPELQKYQAERKAEIYYLNGREALLLGRRLEARGDFIQSIRHDRYGARYYLGIALTWKVADRPIRWVRELKRTLRGIFRRPRGLDPLP